MSKSCCHEPDPKSTPSCHSSATEADTAPEDAQSACCETPASRPDYLLWTTSGGVLLLYVLHLLAGTALADIGWLATWSATAYEMINTMWWGMALAVVFVGILEHIPQQWVMAVLGQGQRLSGILRATMAGVLLDLCSHGILMVGMKLYQRGASLGQVMAFLLASPWNSLSLTLILITLIGLPWTLAFIALSMLVGIVAGLIVDALVVRRRLPANPNTMEAEEDFRLWPAIKSEVAGINWRWRLPGELLWQGLKDSRMVFRWVFLGVLIAGAVRAFMDLETFQTLFGPTLMGLGLTLVAATIIEVCSEGSTPIAADVFNRGGAKGNSFAFLMTGVATDYTEIMSIRDTTRSWKIALALPVVTVPQVILIGWILNQF